MLRTQGAKDEDIIRVEAGIAAEVVAAQGKYVMDRVAVHLGQEKARCKGFWGRRRRQSSRANEAYRRSTDAAEKDVCVVHK